MQTLIKAILAILITASLSWAESTVVVVGQPTVTTPSYWESFDAADGVELSTLSGWSLTTDGTQQVLISTSGAIHDGTGVAVLSYVTTGHSRYVKAAEMTQTNALLTTYFYCPTGDGDTSYRPLFELRGNANATEIGWARVDTASSTQVSVKLYAGGSIQTIGTANRNAWNKLELEFYNNSGTYQVRASLNDGTESSWWNTAANYALSHVRIVNNAGETEVGTTLRIDSMSFSDGGTL